jgi:hypothetical protein
VAATAAEPSLRRSRSWTNTVWLAVYHTTSDAPEVRLRTRTTLPAFWRRSRTVPSLNGTILEVWPWSPRTAASWERKGLARLSEKTPEALER